MIACHKQSISLYCLFLTIFLSLLVCFLLFYFQDKEKANKQEEQTKVVLTMQAISEQERPAQRIIEPNQVSVWKIQIPRIGLEAPIRETTSLQTMKKAVGHFEISSKWDGNVCLAAHNRGNEYGFFQKINLLQKGDKIFYQTEKGRRIYEVNLKQQIQKTNWYYLQDTKQNQLTLITCVKNEPNKRICIQAKQVNG